MATHSSSPEAPVSRRRPRCHRRRRPTRPPTPAPTRNPARALSDAPSEKPGAPARAKPRNTTLPVMLATKTRPRLRMLTASTNPVTTVRASRSAGSGPCRSSASSTGPSASLCMAASLSGEAARLRATVSGGLVEVTLGLSRFPHEAIRVGERSGVAADDDAVRPSALRGDTRILGQRTTAVERQLHRRRRRCELDVPAPEAPRHGETVVDVEPLARDDVLDTQQEDHVVDLPSRGAGVLLR